MSNSRKFFLVICMTMAALFMQDCASTSRIIETTPVRSRLSAYQSLLLVVESDVEYAEEQMDQLKGALMSYFQESERFKRVSMVKDAGAAFDLELHVKIIELHKVSQGERMMGGAFAGRAKLSAEVVLLESRTGQKVGEVVVEGKSSGGTIFAGGTDQSVKRVVDGIIDFIEANY